MPGPLKRSHKLPKGVGSLAQAAKKRGRGGQIIKRIRIEEGLRGDLGATTPRGDRLMDRPSVSKVTGSGLSASSGLSRVEDMQNRQTEHRNVGGTGRSSAVARSILNRGGRVLGIAAPAGVVSTAKEYKQFRSRKKTLRQSAAEKRGGKRM